MPCDGVTHTNANKKSVVDLLWTAPDTESDLAEGVHFVYTVVEEKTKFWVSESCLISDEYSLDF